MVLDRLEELGLQKYLVIFSSDNGGGASNKPPREERPECGRAVSGSHDRGGPSVPSNSQCDKPVAQWDYLSTM